MLLTLRKLKEPLPEFELPDSSVIVPVTSLLDTLSADLTLTEPLANVVDAPLVTDTAPPTYPPTTSTLAPAETETDPPMLRLLEPARAATEPAAAEASPHPNKASPLAPP